VAHAYADREAAVETLEELLETEPTARALGLLDATAGTVDDEPVYRPFLTAALVFASARNTRRVHEAEGVKFDTPLTTILALLDEQAAWDADVTIPPQWTVEAVRERLTPKPGGWAPGIRTQPVTVTSTF